MDADFFLDRLRESPAYMGQIVHQESIPARQARFGDLESTLHPRLQYALEKMEQFPLYTHQAAAVNLVQSGRNIIVSTPSASGKTHCYNVSVLDAILKGKGARALYLFPTKALAQDQGRRLKELISVGDMRIKATTFDGDTPVRERGGIRKSAQIVISNPDMLHMAILPNHRSWSEFLGSLKFVVIDEAHMYRGVFGSHVSNVLRRLRRLSAHYGANPRFICCSATIANPKEHAESLIGLPFEVVSSDGASYGGKEFILWNPPFIDDAKSSRLSASSESVHLLTHLMRGGIRSLAFARTRKLVELMYIHVRDQLAGKDPKLAKQIKPYRAGYTHEDRRKIERRLFNGELLATVATTALETGIDIGDLDATVLSGYPGSVAGAWQQAGRSGRGSEGSLSILVGSENPLDQYVMRHPETLFGRDYEHALISPQNPHILAPHVLCAAWEWPLNALDEKFFGEFAEVCRGLEEKALLHKRGKRWYPTTTVDYPARDVSIRSTSSQNYALVDAETGQVLETVESAVAFSQVHPGAIYLHQGDAYAVVELNFQTRVALALPSKGDFYTQSKEVTELDIVEVIYEKEVGEAVVCLGEVAVTKTVIAFKKKRVFTEEMLGEELLELPSQSFSTVAFWFTVPPSIESKLNKLSLDFPGGLHAAEHAAIAMLPLFALCDRNDIGGVSTPLHPDTGRAQIFIYDAHPGGVGIAEKGFELVEDLWSKTLKLLSECPCEDGCPSCVQSPKCGNNNHPLDKKAARIIFEILLGRKACH